MIEILNAILPAQGVRRVLVVGDLILDEYLRGAVHRISPEAPVPVLESGRLQAVPGGAGNVACNLAALGCEVLLCGAVGDDVNGRTLLDLLARRGIDTRGVLVDRARPTTHKLRVIAHHQQVLRIDREEKLDIGAGVADRALEQVGAMLGKVDGVICSDYGKGFLTTVLLRRIIAASKKAGLRVAVDPKGRDYTRYHGVDVITPNLRELEQGTGLPAGTAAERDRAAAALLERTEAGALLVTCGADGMVLYEAGGRVARIEAEAREVFDVTGAGDTVVAVMSLGLFSGVDLAAAARLANSAAGVVVGKLGTATVSREELARQVDSGVASHSKLLELETLRCELERARAHNRRVVFTNGCFDLLHAGHVAYLERARAFGDLLVVGLNSDASVRALKGAGRPLVEQGDRARVLAGLACVDYVVPFDEPTPTELVAAIRPDVLVKGADYRLDEVAGRETVESSGGRVELVPLEPGRSTSGLIRAIIQRFGGQDGTEE